MLHKNIWNYKDAFDQNLYLINRKKIIEENNKEFVITPINKFEKSSDMVLKLLRLLRIYFGFIECFLLLNGTYVDIEFLTDSDKASSV